MTTTTFASTTSPTHDPPSLLSLCGTLLRQPTTLLGDDPVTTRTQLSLLAPKLLAITLLGGGALGVVLGSYRGAEQLLYAGLKTPLLLLLPVLLGLPALRAFLAACEVALDGSRLALGALLAVARTALLGASTSPILWLYLSLTPDYHRAVLAMAGTLVLIGVPGLWTLLHTLPEGGEARPLAHAAALVVLGVLLAQSGWLLRPFIVRPRAEITFLRPIESNVFSSLAATRRSASGNYRDWDARGGGLLGSDSQQEAP